MYFVSTMQFCSCYCIATPAKIPYVRTLEGEGDSAGMHEILNKFSDLDNSTGVTLPQSKSSETHIRYTWYTMVDQAYGIRECT